MVRHELLEIYQLIANGLELLVPRLDGLLESLEAADVHGRAGGVSSCPYNSRGRTRLTAGPDTWRWTFRRGSRCLIGTAGRRERGLRGVCRGFLVPGGGGVRPSCGVVTGGGAVYLSQSDAGGPGVVESFLIPVALRVGVGEGQLSGLACVGCGCHVGFWVESLLAVLDLV